MKEPRKPAPEKSKAKKNSLKKLSAEEFAAVLKPLEKALHSAGGSPLKMLADADVHSPVCICGKEPLRIKRLLDWLKKQIFFSEGQSNTTVFFGSEINSGSQVSRLRDAVLNFSLFSSVQLVIIYNADKIKAAQAKDIASFLRSPSPASFVIITAESASAKPGGLTALLADSMTVVEIAELEGNNLKRWIEKEALHLGAAGIDQEAIEALERSYGSDVSRLSQELSKLALLAQKDETISKRLVERTSFQTPEHSSFELLNQIARKNVALSLTLAREIVDQGQHPLQLASFLSRSLRILLALKTSVQGGAESDLPSELANPWFARHLRPLLPLFTPEELKTALELLKMLDLRLKSSGLPGPTVLASFVQRLASRDLSKNRRAA